MSNIIWETLSYYKHLILNESERKKLPTRVLTTAETLKAIREHRYSLSRYGDGEFDLIFGNSLKFQKYDQRLAEKMKSILSDTPESDVCKVAIPRTFESLKGLTRNSKRFWSLYLLDNRKKIYDILSPSYTYYDAQITRIYVNRQRKSDSVAYFRQWKELWSGEDLLVVEGVSSRFGAGNDLFVEAKSVQRILCPAKDAFDYYDEIIEAVVQHGQNKLVLLALGPTATALAYDLSHRGIWTIDSGNLDMEYEWSNIRAKTQVAIKGKYTHEAENGTDVSEITDKNYESQIIARIGI